MLEREDQHQAAKSERHVRASLARRRHGAPSGASHPHFRHGGAGTTEYNSWCAARTRCHDPRHPRYAEWGGRGIRMCDRWRESFAAFLEDMGPKPAPGMSLDRIDGSKGYEPGNCRWATAKEQSANRPTWARMLTFDGVTLTTTDWAARIGVSREALRDRLARMSVEQALTMPPGGRRARK